MSQNATGIVRLAHSASRECAAGESRPQGVLAPDGQRMSIAAAAGIDLKAANKFHASGQFRKCGERGGTPHHIGPGNQVERVSRAVEGQDGIESPERSRVLSPSSSSVSKGAPRTLLARRSRFRTVQATFRASCRRRAPARPFFSLVAHGPPPGAPRRDRAADARGRGARSPAARPPMRPMRRVGASSRLREHVSLTWRGARRALAEFLGTRAARAGALLAAGRRTLDLAALRPRRALTQTRSRLAGLFACSVGVVRALEQCLADSSRSLVR